MGGGGGGGGCFRVLGALGGIWGFRVFRGGVRRAFRGFFRHFFGLL